MNRFLILLTLFLFPAWLPAQSGDVNLTQFVDPRIGVLAEGATVIGPALPFGSVHPSPDTPNGGNDGYRPDRPIRGFSQTHVSGTGWGQYGNVLISPQVGLAVGETEHDSPKADEKATAYDYTVRLTQYDVLTEFTPTAHAVFYQFTFPKSDSASIAIDVVHQIPGDAAKAIKGSVKDANLTWSDDRKTVSGSAEYRGGFGHGAYTIYFQAELDRAAEITGTWKNGQISDSTNTIRQEQPADRVGGYARYKTEAGDVLKMKIGISFKSIEKARENLHAEIPDFDFAATRTAARAVWEKTLASVQIEEPDETRKTIFYTAMYHAHIMPRNRTGEFKRFADDVPMWDDHYAVWDT